MEYHGCRGCLTPSLCITNPRTRRLFKRDFIVIYSLPLLDKIKDGGDSCFICIFKRTVLINSTGLRENRAATAGDSAGEHNFFLSGLCLSLFACLCVYACLLLLICFVCYFGFSWGLLFYKSYTRIWGTHEIGWMIIQVDLIGEYIIPYLKCFPKSVDRI